ALAERAEGGLSLVDFAALELEPELAERFEHVVLVDPPSGSADEVQVGRPRLAGAPSFLHELWTESERRFALTVAESQAPSRETVATVFKALREAGECGGSGLREALAVGGAHPLGPVAAARCFRVLAELDLVHGEPDAGDGTVGVVSSGGTKLERSTAFRSYSEEFLEARLYLERRKLS
ncbi:MAG: hypothetical protein WBL45_13130, partial [Solirubrobacterales bacterium]